MSLIQLTIASIKMFFRDKRALFFTLFLPILFMTIFGIADFDKFAKAKVGLIDQAQSAESKQLVENLEKIDLLSIEKLNQDISRDEVKKKLEKGEIDLALELPNPLLKSNLVDLEIPGLKLPPSISKPQVPQFETTKLNIYLNQAKIMQAQNALAVLREVFNKLNFQVSQTKEIFSFEEISLSDKVITYVDFLVPGIIALAIMQMSLFSIIFTIVGYKERGVMKRLQTTPLKPLDFILSQVVTRLLVTVLQLTILVLIAVYAFNVNVLGSYWLMALVATLGAVVFITMGISLSGIAKTQNTAAPLANILMMPMMFLGDVFFPVDTMPDWLQGVVKYLPLNYLSDALRKVMIEGMNFSEITTQIYALLIWSVVMIILASLAFRWKTEN